MKLKLTSELPSVQKKISEYSHDDVISNIEIIELSKLADEHFKSMQLSNLDEYKEVIQNSVDDISQALQKMAVAVGKNKPTQGDFDKLNEAVQFQLLQVIINYNRTIGRKKFK